MNSVNAPFWTSDVIWFFGSNTLKKTVFIEFFSDTFGTLKARLGNVSELTRNFEASPSYFCIYFSELVKHARFREMFLV